MWKSNHSRDRDVMQFESDIPSIHSPYGGDEFTIRWTLYKYRRLTESWRRARSQSAGCGPTT